MLKVLQKSCPVDIGRLRNSITHSLNKGDKSVSIGTNVEYAIYVEEDETKAHKGSTGAHFCGIQCRAKKAPTEQ